LVKESYVFKKSKSKKTYPTVLHFLVTKCVALKIFVE
jgi:hypothetical protein